MTLDEAIGIKSSAIVVGLVVVNRISLGTSLVVVGGFVWDTRVSGPHTVSAMALPCLVTALPSQLERHVKKRLISEIITLSVCTNEPDSLCMRLAPVCVGDCVGESPIRTRLTPNICVGCA